MTRRGERYIHIEWQPSGTNRGVFIGHAGGKGTSGGPDTDEWLTFVRQRTGGLDAEVSQRFVENLAYLPRLDIAVEGMERSYPMEWVMAVAAALPQCAANGSR